MENKNMEILKNVFAHSSDNVFFTDYEFNILWCNNSGFLPVLETLKSNGLFRGESLPLKSGEYSLKCNGLTFLCRVINYPENELYVIMCNKDDALYSFIKCRTIQEFLINQAGAVRQAVTGITVSSNVLHRNLERAGLYTDSRYLDITIGNCYKLLRTVMNTTELIRYTDGSLESKLIDVSSVIKEFTSVCRSIIGSKIKLKAESERKLFINADPERFITCLLSMVILVNGKNPLNNIICITAEKIGEDWVSITARSDRTGEEPINRTFSKFNELYSGDELNSDLFIINRFCQEFSGMFFTAGDEANRSCSIKLPCSDNHDDIVEFNSSIRPYPTDKFSKYHIALSDIADIYYY